MQFRSLYFDLDDTLYPSSSGLWEAIRERMNTYMQKFMDLPIDQIVKLRQSYLENYGTTLRGLQAHYAVDPDGYLAFVHDLPLDKYLHPDPGLRKLLLSLPQRRWVFTNSDARHAKRVLKVLELDDCFDGIIDIWAVDFACKPDKTAYRRALSITGEEQPARCAIFDDAVRNLTPAHEMGLYTVLVGSNDSQPAVDRSIHSLHDLKVSLPELWEKDDG